MDINVKNLFLLEDTMSMTIKIPRWYIMSVFFFSFFFFFLFFSRFLIIIFNCASYPARLMLMMKLFSAKNVYIILVSFISHQERGRRVSKFMTLAHNQYPFTWHFEGGQLKIQVTDQEPTFYLLTNPTQYEIRVSVSNCSLLILHCDAAQRSCASKFAN